MPLFITSQNRIAKPGVMVQRYQMGVDVFFAVNCSMPGSQRIERQFSHHTGYLTVPTILSATPSLWSNNAAPTQLLHQLASYKSVRPLEGTVSRNTKELSQIQWIGRFSRAFQFVTVQSQCVDHTRSLRRGRGTFIKDRPTHTTILSSRVSVAMPPNTLRATLMYLSH